jgi:uncharacterized protein (DUF433 family)
MSTATTTAVVEIGELISSRPDFRGGAPCIFLSDWNDE